MFRFEGLKEENEISNTSEDMETQYEQDPVDETRHEEETKPEMLAVPPPVKPQPQKSNIARKRKGNSIFNLLLVASILWLCFCVYFVAPVKLNFTSHGSFFQIASKHPAELNESKLKPEEQVLPPASTPTGAIEDNSKAVEEKNTRPLNSSPSSAQTEQGTPDNNYYIVAGSFRLYDNAKESLEELKLEGYKNAQIINNKKGLSLVCYDSFNNIKEANEKIKSLKEQQKHSWIYKR